MIRRRTAVATEETSRQWKRLELAAVLAIGLHLLAGLAMFFILKHGLNTNPNLLERMGYLVEHRSLWIAGWLCWNFAALSILNFMVAFETVHQDKNPHVLRLAVLVTASAMAADLSAEAIEMGLVPWLAQNALTTLQTDRLAGANAFEPFLSMHRVVILMSGFAANGLYTFATACAVWSTRKYYTNYITASGIAVVVAGIAVSVTAMADSTEGMFWSNALILPFILLWQTGILLDAKRHANAPVPPCAEQGS